MEGEREGEKVVVMKMMSGGVNVPEENWDSCSGTSVITLTGDGGGAFDIRIVVGDGEGTGGEVCGSDKALVNGVLDGMVEMA